MAYTYHGTSNLIALPNRTVQTYPSGLVRVEQSFICRKADAATYRKQLKVGGRMPKNEAPAIDGLFIFPDPAEAVRDDGFTEFRVTAYGRTNREGQRVRSALTTRSFKFSAQISRIDLDYDPNNSSTSQTQIDYIESPYFYDAFDVYFRFCVLANEKIQQPTDIRSIGGAFVTNTDIDLFSQSFSAAEIFPILRSGFVPSSTEKISPVFYALQGGFERTNFGSFDEVSISYIVQTSNINFGSFFNEASPPAKQILESQYSIEDGAVIYGLKMPYSDGVQVKIGNETLSAAYGSGFRGNTFQIGLSGSGQFTLIIRGLASSTVYQAQIAAFNKNGAGASTTTAFKTGNNFLFAG